MDMDSTPGQKTQSWLGFSLSNPNHRHHRHHHHQHQHIINNINLTPPSSSSSSSSDSTQRLCLFEVFHHPSSSAPAATAVRTAAQGEEDAGRAADHCILTGGCGPKLEDFLGGCTADVPRPPHAPAALIGGHLSTDHVHIPVTSNIANAISNSTYDSELKTIAASFLRGLPAATEQTDTQKQQQQQQYHQQSVVHTELAPKKSIDTFGQRTSIYRGVTRHRWTGRYEAHLWDNSCRREGQSRKGRQVYLGGYDKEDKAARAYDLAALKYWGPTTTTNFPVSNYEKDLEEMKNMTRQEFVASLRRKSSGFSRGASIYRGVTRHHQHGRWQARIGRVAGNKDLYLGTFSTQEEAAEAYDIAAIKFRGLNAVTNFNISRYDVKSIVNSNLPIGGITTKSKNSSESASDSKSIDGSRSDDLSSASSVTFAPHQQHPASTATLSFAIPIKEDPSDYWSSILGYQINTACTTLQNAKNNNDGPVAPSTFFQPSAINGYALQFQSPASLRADLKTYPPGNDSGNNSGLFFNPGFIQQQSGSAGVSGSGNHTSSSSSSLQFATPIALSSSSGSYEGNSIYGNWIAQSSHSLQSAKPNLSVFQTPIFGME